MNALKNILLRAPLLALALLFTRQVRGEFNPGVVSGDARWVIYADLNALRESPIGKQLVTAAGNFQVPTENVQLRLNAPKILATIGSITAYGANFTKDAKQVDGSLIIQGTPELRKIAEALLIEANLAHPEAVAEIKELGYSAYSISSPEHPAGPRVIVAFPPEPIVLVSKSAEHLRRARELFQGQGKSLAQSPDSPLNALTGEAGHSTLFAASVVPSEQLFPDNAPQARLLHMATSGSIALGDQEGKTFAHAQLIASSNEMADKLQKILQGMAAMLALGESSDQQLNDFLNSAVVARQDNTVTLKLAYSSERLAVMIQHMIESAPAHRARSRGPAMGQVAATWTIAPAPATGDADGEQVPVPALKGPNATLTNGAAITVAIESTDPRAWTHFQRLRITPAEVAAGEIAAPLVFSRKFMTEVRLPSPRRAEPSGTEAPPGASRIRLLTRQFQFYFPGETGTYTLEANFTPVAAAEVKLSVAVMKPAADEAAAEKP
jgi:hypothetical protein